MQYFRVCYEKHLDIRARMSYFISTYRIYAIYGDDPMVNINKLRGRMVEHQVNADQMTSLLGIDRATFCRN